VDAPPEHALAEYEEEERNPDDPKWKILVPRLRSLITEPEPDVSFSFSFSILPDGSDTNIVQPQPSKSFGNDADNQNTDEVLQSQPVQMPSKNAESNVTGIPSKPLPPTSFFATDSIIDRPAEAFKGTISSVINTLVKESLSKPKPSDSSNKLLQNNMKNPKLMTLDNSDSDDEMTVASAFMRNANVEDMEKMWLNNRQHVVQEYKKKSKEAVRRERQKDNQRIAKRARNFPR
jgi:hypothetical protein